MPARVVGLTALALIGFAANSILTRAGLASGAIDPASFLAIRLVSGAVTLAWLARRDRGVDGVAPLAPPWTSAAALAGYGVAFTYGYTRIGAGLGALALFGAVQATMIAVALARGERPGWRAAAGWLLAISGLITLTLPGSAVPSRLGVLLMLVGGACWGVYTLLGRGAAHPVHSTALNFRRAVPAALVVLAWEWSRTHANLSGVALAITSGALTSGVGYALWYAALPHLTAWRAAVVQLLTPVLTALAASAWLAERPTWRLITAGALIVGGVALSLAPVRRTGPPDA